MLFQVGHYFDKPLRSRKVGKEGVLRHNRELRTSIRRAPAKMCRTTRRRTRLYRAASAHACSGTRTPPRQNRSPVRVGGDHMGYFTSLYSSELPHRATVYMYLRDRCDKDGKCPRHWYHRRRLKLSRSTVKEPLPTAIRCGRLRKEQRWRETAAEQLHVLCA